jgi:uncharacterized protein
VVLCYVFISDEVLAAVLSKLVKQRKDSISSYTSGGRHDLAESEQRECDLISSYLPQQMSALELDDLVDSTIVELGASSVKDMGKVSYGPRLVWF